MQRDGIELGSLPELPDTGVVAGGPPEHRNCCGLALERGQHLRGVDRRCIRAVTRAEPRRRGASGEGLDELRAVGGDEQRGQLRRCRVEQEVGRRHAGGGIVAESRSLVVELPAERREARQIGFGVGSRRDRVLGVEEIGDRLVRARLLADDVRRRAVAAAAEVERLDRRPRLRGVGDDVEVEPVGGRQRRAVDRRQPPKLALRQHAHRSAAGIR